MLEYGAAHIRKGNRHLGELQVPILVRSSMFCWCGWVEHNSAFALDGSLGVNSGRALSKRAHALEGRSRLREQPFFPPPSGHRPAKPPTGGKEMLTQDQIQALKSSFPPEALSADTSRGFELTSVKAAQAPTAIDTRCSRASCASVAPGTTTATVGSSRPTRPHPGRRTKPRPQRGWTMEKSGICQGMAGLAGVVDRNCPA
jgi:hypothetical protein